MAMRVAVTFFRFIVAAVSLIFAHACNITEELPTYDESTIVGVGDYVPEFEVLLPDGTLVRSNDFRGEPFLLILFSHTCPDCKSLFDDIQQQIMSGAAVPKILAIGRDATIEDVVAYAEANGYTMPMAPDADREVFSLFATTYVPRTYLVGRDGRVEMLAIEYDPSYVPALVERALKL
jgi:peroxiredoxin